MHCRQVGDGGKCDGGDRGGSGLVLTVVCSVMG